MPIRNWLLTGTSLTILALAPLSAPLAQDANDPTLVKAYAAFQADPSDANREALNQACIAAGYQSLDECISAITGQKPVDQPSSEAAPASSETAAPADSSSETAAPVESSSSEAAPVETSSSAVAPTSSSAEAAPVTSSAEATSSSAEAVSSEAAPTPSSSEAAPAPSSFEAAPVSSSVEASSSSAQAAPASSAPAGDVLAQLTAAVEAYNTAVGKVDAGDASARAEADAALAQITAICTSAGFTDTTACLAQFSLTLNPLPSGEASAASSAPASNASSSAAPASESPQASEVVSPSAVEVLPSNVASEAAPILDSAKDAQNASSAPSSEQPTQPDASSSAAAPVSSSSAPQQPAPAPTAPPKSDADAQASLQPPPDQQVIITEQGQPKGSDFVFVQPPPPPNVQVVETPKQDRGGIVFRIGVNIYINNPAQTRDRLYDRNRGDQIYYEDLSRGRTRETIERRDGTKIITIYDRYGDVLQRTKVYPEGRTIILASYDPQDDQDLQNWRDPGEDLPPLVLNIPANQYILDADSADEDQVQQFLSQPPVEQVRRIYSIDEVKRSARLRDSVRRLEIGDLTFATGKATISRDQVGSLATVAKAMQQLLQRNPGEVFLIEGHTDAVGSDVANLVLSDERAATVAKILTDFYQIPAENLVTQGYGERYLKVKTEGPEELNRRVTVKRITPLVTYETANR